MTNEERKLIFDYCGWCQHKNSSAVYCVDCGEYNPKHLYLDGNDILEAVNIMESKGDWLKFTSSVELRCYQYIKLTPSEFPYLLQNFFPLMAEWLKERAK